MDLHRLDQTVQKYYSAALTASTHKTYRSAENRYLKFCDTFKINPLPVTEPILCYYVACLGQEGLSAATIKTYLSGVRQVQISQGFPEPHLAAMPRLQQVLRGVRVEQGKSGRAPRPRLPITPGILRRMKRIWEAEGVTWDTTMLWAASSVTFFSFCRSGELTVPTEKGFDPSSHVTYNDISVDNRKSPSIVSIHLKKSKTDPFREGMRVTVGRTNNEICPVAALLSYLSRRGDRPGPLFQWKDGRPLTRDQFVKAVRTTLRKANLPAEQYAGHSFRIGAATTAATVGIEDSLIQTLGRWKSSAYLLYVRLDPNKLAAISGIMAASSV